MKCEICGKDTVLPVGAYGVWLCEQHREQVLAYIESLKPKPLWRVERTVNGYVMWERSQEGPQEQEVLQHGMCTEAADALYEFMRREHEG